MDAFWWWVAWVIGSSCAAQKFMTREQTAGLAQGVRRKTAKFRAWFLLPNHLVLAVGGGSITGRPFRVADVFMPAQLAWSETHHPNEVRDQHTTTLLQDGRVLIAGGSGVFGTTLSSAELFIYRQQP